MAEHDYNTEIYLGKEFKDKLLAGVDKSLSVLEVIYGRNSKSVYTNEGLTNDGVNSLKYVYSLDKCEDLGCKIIRDVTKMIEEKVGNATTTTGLLTANMVKNYERIKNKQNTVDAQATVNKYFDNVLRIGESLSYKLDKNDIEKLAFDSSRDYDMAKFCVDLFERDFFDNYFTIHDGLSNDFFIDYNKNKTKFGFSLFHYNNTKELTNPKVYSYPNKIDNISILDSIMSQIGGDDSVLILGNVDPYSANVIRTKIDMHESNIICLHATNKINVLDDFTNIYRTYGIMGAQGFYLTEHIGISYMDISGVCIGESTLEKVNEEIEAIKKQILEKSDQDEINLLKSRINHLMGRTFEIKLKSNKINSKWQTDKFLDTMNDLNTLKESGGAVVDGGGVVFKDIANSIGYSNEFNNAMHETLVSPLKTIIRNTIYDKEVDLNSVSEVGVGFDSENSSICKMKERAIVTPYNTFFYIVETLRNQLNEWVSVHGAIFNDFVK